MKLKRWIKVTVAAGLLALVLAAPASAGVIPAGGPSEDMQSGWCRTC